MPAHATDRVLKNVTTLALSASARMPTIDSRSPNASISTANTAATAVLPLLAAITANPAAASPLPAAAIAVSVER